MDAKIEAKFKGKVSELGLSKKETDAVMDNLNVWNNFNERQKEFSRFLVDLIKEM